MISIGVGALILAICFSTLFVGKSVGLSMLLFVISFSYFFIYILEKNGKIKNKKAKFLLVPIILLSSTYFIYNNSFFSLCNLIVIPTLFIFLILSLIGEKMDLNKDLLIKFFGVIFNPINYIGESTEQFLKTIRDINKPNFSNNEIKKGKIKKIVKAIVTILPLIIVILVLLSTADEIFANMFKTIFDFFDFSKCFNNIDTIVLMVLRFTIMVIFTFYFMGLFYFFCTKHNLENELINENTKINDNFTIKILLVTLNIIYFVFCYIQIKSLFLKNTSLNYAQYARQGFFQLMAVSLINIVTILIAKKRENKDDYKTNKFINYMSIIMIGFTFIIVISAWVRMHFYESAYGYTLLRLLVYCTLFTESILFIPTILYILDKKIDLIKSYFIIIIVMYLCMNFVNFDSIIAKRNIDRYFETGKIDLEYLKNEVGTDGIKQIVRLLKEPRSQINEKKEVRMNLSHIYDSLNNYEENMDFRDFNISKIYLKNILKKTINKY